MDKDEKFKVMTEAAAQLKNMIQKRAKNRVDMLNSIAATPMDNSLPDEVRKMREEESSKLRAVIQEQNDIIEIITMLFPNA